MDKIKINPFVSAHHGKHVDFNKRGIFSNSVLLFMENKKMVACKFSRSIKTKNYDKIDLFLL